MNAADRPTYDTDRLDTVSPRVVGDGAVDTKHVHRQVGRVDRGDELGVQTSVG